MKEHRVEVRRGARYYTLGEPGPEVREVWVALHGYRQLAGRFLRRFRPLDDGTRWIAAPEALSRFYVEERVGRHGPDSRVGATWMTREDRRSEIADYVAYLDRVAETLFGAVERGDVRLVVLGFSQGVATAARWAALGRWPADALVAWGDSLPPDLDETRARERLGGLDLLLVRGSDDATRRPAEEAKDEDRLARWGADARVVMHPGGHRIEEDALREVAREVLRTPR